MNSFLNRIIAPGLRRIEPRLASFRKAVLPRKGMSQIEESPPFEKDDPKGRPEKGPVITPETPPQPPDPNRALASLEKTSTSPSDGKKNKRGPLLLRC